MRLLRRLARVFLALGAARAGLANEPAREAYRDDFTHGLEQWVVEQMPGGTVTVQDGAMVINDVGGCTVWLRAPLSDPVAIRYEITVVSAGGPHDRVSDLNCFWMAQDPRAPGNLLAPGHHRTGAFGTYDSLLTYYVGYGGNDNTTTRFRRYDGTGARPLLPQYDLKAPHFLLISNHAYQIELVARFGTVEFWRDHERIFSFQDPNPLEKGWFGIRTVHSHLVIRHFWVEKPG